MLSSRGLKMKDNKPDGNSRLFVIRRGEKSMLEREGACARVKHTRDCSIREIQEARRGPDFSSVGLQVLEESILTCQYWILCQQSCLGWISWIRMHCLFGLYSCNFQMPKPLLAAASGRCSWTTLLSRNGLLQNKAHVTTTTTSEMPQWHPS